jgi:hypothetical protein
MEYGKFRDKIIGLQSDWGEFQVEFLDETSFKSLTDRLLDVVGGYTTIYITGYFSKAIEDQLTRLLAAHKIRLISPELTNDRKDQRNLEVMRKLVGKGAEIKINNRMHARFLVAHTPDFHKRGIVILGSFDFNTECMGGERYDIGIKTTNPDLVESTIALFEKIWKEPESVNLLEKYP